MTKTAHITVSNESQSSDASTLEIAIEIEAGGWPPKSDLETLVRLAASEALAEIQTSPGASYELGVVFTDDGHIARLNSTWRNKTGATNVLSFPLVQLKLGDTPPPLLGDIVLAFETVAREADEQNKSFADHLTHLVVHGFLHLLGHDHVNDDEAEMMEALETRILQRLAIPDPYA